MSGGLPDELPPDFEFGAYVIRGCIGRGGMARIYRAEHGTLRRSVALKVLDRWLLEQPTGRERFLREARAAAAIKHPHVVDILDVGVWCDRPFIVMELLTGCDLATYLDDCGTLSNREIASLALPVIAGVMAVHDAGVVHRDLKPSNIFLAKEPEGLIVPKVLDFGVSKVSGTLIDSRPGDTQSRDIVGTPAYMAPEGLEGVGRLGPAGDQYALGAVLYECAVGRPPFEGETLLGLLRAVAVGDIQRPSELRPDISPEIERVILQAIERDPKDRFPSLRDMGRALWPLADERTKTVWEHCFGNAAGAGNREQIPSWVGFRMQREEKGRRRAGWREGWRSFTGLMGRPWARVLAVSLLLSLLAGGVWLSSDAPTPVASAVVGASPVDVQTGEPSSLQRAPSPPEASSAPPASPEDAANAARQVEPAPAAPALTTVTAALHGANAERDRGAAQRAPGSAPVRRKTVRKNASRTSGSSRAEVTAASAPVNEESKSTDALDEPFTKVRKDSRPVGPGSDDDELDGLFPGLTRKLERGANRAPIPD
jgi:serine/threonine-protein kinase